MVKYIVTLRLANICATGTDTFNYIYLRRVLRYMRETTITFSTFISLEGEIKIERNRVRQNNRERAKM